MSALHAMVGYLLAARLAELAFAARNTRRLKAGGGIEHGAGHYPWIVALHAGWIAALLVFVDPARRPDPMLLGLFVALQAARLWVVITLSTRWTTRIIVVPGEPLVTRGPYRWLRHPNYLIVVAEIATVPMIFGAWQIAIVFSAANLALLHHRIRVENAALAGAALPAERHME